MRKIKMLITSSIDGYVASPDGDLEWMSEYYTTERLEYDYRRFLSETDTVIMGANTYRSLNSMEIIRPYKGKKVYIITHNPDLVKGGDNIFFISENVVNEVSAIKEKNGNDIALIGGGEVIKLFLQADFIDEMIILTVPILLGDGISLFTPYFKMSKWRILNSDLLENGLLQAIYGRV
jgi:dihydrofolate reductase